MEGKNYVMNDEGEYGKYVVQTLHAPAVSPEFAEIYKQWGNRLLWIDSKVVPGAFQMNMTWYHSAPDMRPLYKHDEHSHDYAELIGFIGSNPEDPYDLGGVIEVGINVPNATVMVIENAERFGLAQLHQLRGRVGRGKAQSYCFLINEGQSELAAKRGSIMESSADGFFIAEEDLKLRGPGEIFGTRQHGLPDMKLADMARHMNVLAAARDEAKAILEDDPALVKPQNQPLKRRVIKLFGEDLSLNL